MSNPIINDNGVDREMTDDELAAHKQLQKEFLQHLEAVEKEIAAKAAARAAVLAKLGLTADEAAALLG